MAENDDTAINIKYNAAKVDKHIVYEDDDVIEVPVILMAEGVWKGSDGIPTLRLYEDFKNEAHWLDGQPILRGHTLPTEIVTHKHNKIGKIRDVRTRDDNKDVAGIARYFKRKLTPEDLDKIRNDQPYDGSIAYTTDTVYDVEGDYFGTKYNAVEGKSGQWHFYHFAEVPSGACSVPVCGFKLNNVEKTFGVLNCGCPRNKNKPECIGQKGDAKHDDHKDVVEIIHNNQGENRMDETKTEQAVTPAPTIDDSNELVQKLNSALERMDSFEKSVGELKTLVETITNGIEAERQEIIKQNAIAQENRDKESFKMRLNQAARIDIDRHYDEFKKTGWQYLDEHPDILQVVVQKQDAAGQSTVTPAKTLADERAALKETLGQRKRR